jgi:acetoin utilization deacetylase AcuC-like enzyme
MAEDFVSRDQHRADLAELRLEIANSLASLDKRTELMAQELLALRRDTERWHGELRQDMQELRQDLRSEMRDLRTTMTRQMWTMISVVTAAVLAGVVKLVLLP